MPLTLIELPTLPGRVAATKVGQVTEDGAFLLDLSRPLEVLRWFAVANKWIGPAIGLFVPVVHQRQSRGEFVISVNKTDPYFASIRELWKRRFPESLPPVQHEADGLTVIADFATQFPEDSQ